MKIPTEKKQQILYYVYNYLDIIMSYIACMSKGESFFLIRKEIFIVQHSYGNTK